MRSLMRCTCTNCHCVPAGTSLMVILELDVRVSILVSATFAAAYTVVGGMYSVSYTDVLQLVCITLGLVSTTVNYRTSVLATK